MANAKLQSPARESCPGEGSLLDPAIYADDQGFLIWQLITTIWTTEKERASGKHNSRRHQIRPRKDGRIHISNALHVFKWESLGFSGMIEDTKKAKADLRPIADVDIPAGAEVFSVAVADGWGL